MNFDRNAKSPAQGRPGAPAPIAAVPISVYRELSAELQATQAMLDSLHGQNQQLRKQNLHLQQEVDSIVQAAQQMQSLGGAPLASHGPVPPQASDVVVTQGKVPQPRQGAPVGKVPPRSPHPQVRKPASRAQSVSPQNRETPNAAVRAIHPGTTGPLNRIFTGREQPLPRSPLESDRPEEISTWWLVAIVMLIVVTAFGTGFMLVRPLMSPHH